MRARSSVVPISGALMAALVLAASALGAHSMTSPTAAAVYKTKNHSGFVAFSWTEVEKQNHTNVQTITGFRFHDGCTNLLTHITAKIHVGKHNRFSYGADDVMIAGRLFVHPNTNDPVVKGTVTLTDPDCSADPNGVITFKATP